MFRAIVFAALAAAAAPALAVNIDTQTVQPADTAPGIERAAPGAYHLVAVPHAAAERKNVLVVFLGGTGSVPDNYGDFAGEAARLGYGVIDLRYPDDVAAARCRGDDGCFTQMRGETIFGEGVAYGHGPYASPIVSVDRANSIVNRLVGVLDWLAHDDAYWGQFVGAERGSPYGGRAPAWSKIVFAGHSQGGGHAAFIGLVVPVRRAIMFSSPNDQAEDRAASWMRATPATDPSRFWGLRHRDDSLLGANVPANWSQLGGRGVGGEGAQPDFDAGNGSIDPHGRHKLVLTTPELATSFAAHNSTVANDPFGRFDAGRVAAWDYLLTAGHSD
jgi:hypothetical protein